MRRVQTPGPRQRTLIMTSTRSMTTIMQKITLIMAKGMTWTIWVVVGAVMTVVEEVRLHAFLLRLRVYLYLFSDD